MSDTPQPTPENPTASAPDPAPQPGTATAVDPAPPDDPPPPPPVSKINTVIKAIRGFGKTVFVNVKGGIDWTKWRDLLVTPDRFGRLISCLMGGILLACVIALKHGCLAFFGTIGLLLLGTRRVFRELLVASALLGVSYFGFSKILGGVSMAGDIHPGKAAIVIAVILAWTVLAALCLGRLHGSRDDD